MWLLAFPIFSILLFIAHLQFWGKTLWILFPLALIAILFIPNRFVARFLQIALIAFAAEWMYSAYMLYLKRIMLGMPWGTAVAILGGVALVTFFSSLVFIAPKVKQHYGL